MSQVELLVSEAEFKASPKTWLAQVDVNHSVRVYAVDKTTKWLFQLDTSADSGQVSALDTAIKAASLTTGVVKMSPVPAANISASSTTTPGK